MDRQNVPAGDFVFVSGYFDPLLAAHVRRLEELRQEHVGLVAVIADPAQPVLPSRARAELAAALACVDWVVVGGDATVHLESEHAALFHDLVRHAARRQGA